MEKKDAGGSNVVWSESCTHDAAGNVVSQVVKDVPTTFSYDRNRLLTATSSGSVNLAAPSCRVFVASFK